MKHSLLFFVLCTSCAAKGVSSPTASAPSEDPIVDASVASPTPSPSVEAPEPVDAAPRVEDAGVIAISDASPPDAKVPATPPPPLVVKGIRKCTEAEASNEVCFEGKTPGMCNDGLCITPNVCPRYCTALAESSTSDCTPGDPKECEGVPECLKVHRETKAMCAKIKKDFAADCVRITCALVRSLPAP